MYRTDPVTIESLADEFDLEPADVCDVLSLPRETAGDLELDLLAPAMTAGIARRALHESTLRAVAAARRRAALDVA